MRLTTSTMSSTRTTSLLHIFLALVLLAVPVYSHMTMADPPPINHRKNPHFMESNADYDYSAPLSPSGSNYPCRGHLKDLNTPRGGSVVNYRPGGTYSFTIEGQATHAGGSCQASLSFDGGRSWKVIKSYIGDCVRAQPGGNQNFRFTIPGDTPTGNAIFAWTWFNNLGNREMYMNCAVVTITTNASKRSPVPHAVPLDPLPHEGPLMLNSNGTLTKRALGNIPLFTANIGNGCTTAAGRDVVFPNPGGDTEFGGNAGARAPPSGNCGAGNFQGGGAVGSGDLGGNGPTVTIPASEHGPEIQVGPYIGTDTANAGAGAGAGSTTSDPMNPPSSSGGENTSSGGTPGTDADDIARIDELRRLSGKHRNDCDFWIQQGFVCSDGERAVQVLGGGAVVLVGVVMVGLGLF